MHPDRHRGVADGIAEIGSDAVSAERFAERHDRGGKNRGKHQRHRDFPQDHRFAGTLDLPHLLKLRVD